jgi:hypothetical protein
MRIRINDKRAARGIMVFRRGWAVFAAIIEENGWLGAPFAQRALAAR